MVVRGWRGESIDGFMLSPRTNTFTTLFPTNMNDIDYLMIELIDASFVSGSWDNLVLEHNPVPEPSTALHLGLGLIGFSAQRRRPASRI